ncbi:MAG: PhoH family protein [Candidatus Dojkabacteria bacterium]|nr:PhoH family protein [Candidatus Dojkabacteria bacterium]
MAKRLKFKKQQNLINLKEEYINLIELNTLDEYKNQNTKKQKIVAKTKKQQDLLNALENDKKPIVIVTGPAGTGKTMISTSYAIESLEKGKYQKIVICRPNIAVDDRDIGYLPGNILEKMAPWTKPFEDIFLEYYKKSEYIKMLEEGTIEIVPLAYIRGRTFKNSFVIIDEAQGTTPNSILSILTRIGENSKYVITGDLKQSDFINTNGLFDLIEKIENRELKYIEHIKFSKDDIQRHPAIKEILDIYDGVITDEYYEEKQENKNKINKINKNGFNAHNLPNFLK